MKETEITIKVKLDQNKQYIITSDLSEITYDNNVELVKMQKVIAIFIDKNNIPLTVISDKAVYNNSNYNTKFRENVKIEYLNNIILADKMDLNFENNTISDSNVYAIFVNHADRFYFGNNSLSSSGYKDIRFNKVTVGNTGKGNNFSTIDVGASAYFAIYNDLTLKFMENETVGFENLDVKVVVVLCAFAFDNPIFEVNLTNAVLALVFSSDTADTL